MCAACICAGNGIYAALHRHFKAVAEILNKFRAFYLALIIGFIKDSAYGFSSYNAPVAAELAAFNNG